MLHWLAGAKQPGGASDPDATGNEEPPETPAPVFAVRAFKHAIFGTPQTVQPKLRRNSTTDNGRQRNGDNKTARPTMVRPKSASDAQTLARPQREDVPEPLASPTKGILLTPGTAAARKKNVTFGIHVQDNEQNRPFNNVTGEEGAGDALADDSDPDEELPGKHRSRVKLTEALEQARDESKKRRSKSDKRSKKLSDQDIDVPLEFAEPKADSGKYWKHAYDEYRANTQREVKKLIVKQKAAKSFAQAKDVQCTELADDLRHERKRVETLEAKIDELSTLMKDLHEQLSSSRKQSEERAEELATLKRGMGRKDSARPESRDTASWVPLQRTASSQQVERDVVDAENDPVQRPSEPYKPPKTSSKAKTDLQALRARIKQKPKASPPKPADDIWAQSFGSSSVFDKRPPETEPLSPTSGGHDAKSSRTTALQAVNINTVANGRETEPRPTATSGEVDQYTTPGGDTTTAAGKPKEHQSRPQRLETLQHATVHKSSEIVDATARDQHGSAEVATGDPDLSIPLPDSSPFQPDAKVAPPSLRRTAAPAGPRGVFNIRTAQPIASAKENVAPTSASSKPQPPPHDSQLKPSAMWTSFSGASTNTRSTSTSVATKDSKQITADRIEAARARLNARGRVVT